MTPEELLAARRQIRGVFADAVIRAQKPYDQHVDNAPVILPEMVAALIELACLIARDNLQLSRLDCLITVVSAVEAMYNENKR